MSATTDTKKLAAAGLKQNFNEKQFASDFRSVLEMAAGRRIVWWVLEEAGVFESSFTGNNTTFYNEGKRALGLKVLGNITSLKPDALILMMQESKKREEANEQPA